MCGIAGFINPQKDKLTLQQMTDALANRGPDDAGLYFKDGVAMGHRRLSIIDVSSAGHQPMFFQDWVILLNGEIYNYREIKNDLESLGYNFISGSDTEVALKAIDKWGTDAVKKFVGMFAIAIYHTITKDLYLIRDRIGVKPLYYHTTESSIAFSSELKGLKPYLDQNSSNTISSFALSSFLSLGYQMNDQSILENVKKLTPGSILHWKNGVVKITPYWELNFLNPEENNRSEDDYLDELEDIIIKAFKYRMVADVPVGVFLSAGIDSSLVAAVLSKHYGQIKTFTIGFNEKGYDESKDALKIAQYLKTDHTDAYLTPDIALDILHSMYDIYDEPHGDNSCIPTTFVSRLAKENKVKVVLSADGGDELFGGYTRYLEMHKRWEQLQPVRKLGLHTIGGIGAGMAAAVQPGSKSNKWRRYKDILTAPDFITFYQRIIRSTSVAELKSVFPDFIEPLVNYAPSTPVLEMCNWDFHHYLINNNLVKVDRATMYNGIEGREPFLDHHLMEFAARLPQQYKIKNGTTKYLLKKLLARYLPTPLFDLPKRGFGAPIQQWLKQHYQDSVQDVLQSPAPMLNTRTVSNMIAQHANKKDINYVLLWQLYSFQMWYNKWKSN